ncbi:hypothetical protein ACYZT3_28525 [Pseudomonas sp. MDT1-16]
MLKWLTARLDSMVDPFFMQMLLENLGHRYIAGKTLYVRLKPQARQA